MFFLDSEHVCPLYLYPRFCVVRWSDHSHAAFYPKIEDHKREVAHTTIKHERPNITHDSLESFVRDYLRDPDKYIIASETF